jgi:hypothetical protein
MTACPKTKLVDAHFARTIAPEEERDLRAHLETCQTCHARYRRRQLLAKLDPEAPSAEARLAHGLGLAADAAPKPEQPRAKVLAFRAFAIASVVAIAALMLLRVAARQVDDGFTPRGPGAKGATSTVQIVRATKGTEPSLIGDAIRANDELAFAYDNAKQKPYLLVFGVDEHGHVYWYHPAWTKAAEDPSAIRIDATGGRHELREAIAHDLDGTTLEIHALFTDGPMTVREIERIVAGRPAPLGRLDAPNAEDYVTTVKVIR